MQIYCISSSIPQDNEVPIPPYGSVSSCNLSVLLGLSKTWREPAVGHSRRRQVELRKLLPLAEPLICFYLFLVVDVFEALWVWDTVEPTGMR